VFLKGDNLMPIKDAASYALFMLAKDNVIMLMGAKTTLETSEVLNTTLETSEVVSGGLSIASALHNYDLDQRLASLVLTRAPGIQKPMVFLLVKLHSFRVKNQLHSFRVMNQLHSFQVKNQLHSFRVKRQTSLVSSEESTTLVSSEVGCRLSTFCAMFFQCL
jgi:hypothetical protein